MSNNGQKPLIGMKKLSWLDYAALVFSNWAINIVWVSVSFGTIQSVLMFVAPEMSNMTIVSALLTMALSSLYIR